MTVRMKTVVLAYIGGLEAGWADQLLRVTEARLWDGSQCK